MTPSPVEWGTASVARPGERVSGDRCLVLANGDGAFIAVVDGVGHGPEAEHAALLATGVLESARGRPVDELLVLCHRALSGSRGAALLLVAFDAADRSLAWAGVGDVLGVLVRADERARPRRVVLMPREGVAGRSIPPAARSLVSVHDGDVLAVATDGIRDDFVEAVHPGDDPKGAAARVLSRHYKGNDDAVAFVGRFRIGAP